MKLKKVLALSMAAALVLGTAGCGDKAKNNAPADSGSTTTPQTESVAVSTEAETAPAEETLNYADIVVGESYQDITAELKVLSQRTDLADTKFADYAEAFNELYPNITITYETITDYAEQALLRVSQSDWDVMMIPAVDKNELPTYFVPFGDLASMEAEVRFANTWMYDNQVYGVASTGNASGIVYNKAVFEAAGVTTLPATPDEFIAALQAIKDNTDAIPMYTNYAAGWTMGGQWDAYISGSTGDSAYQNQKMLHDAAPFRDYGDGTHPYAVYKILYDAVSMDLTEEDYSTTDWEGSKGMINNGEIGCMALGSWAFSQMQEAGENPDDIGYMPFPVSVDGKQYASAGADYSYGVNAQASDDNKKAAMLYVKWLTEQSGFSYSEGGIPIDLEGEYPDLYAAFDGIEYVTDEAATAGEETLKDELNAESELMINAGGDKKVMEIVEHADRGDMTFDEIMESWNQAWSDAQTSLGVTAE